MNDRVIELYGVGISYLEAIALPKTLGRIINKTRAVMYEPPLTEKDYFCYIYYMDRYDRDNGYQVFKENFAITSPIIYKTYIPISEIFGGYDDNDY